MRLARRFAEDRVAVIGLARNVAGHAGGAVAEFARAAGIDAVMAKNIEDRLARPHFIFAARACKSHGESPVIGEAGRRGGAWSLEVFAMHGASWPVGGGRGGGLHHAGWAAIIEVGSGLRLP